MDQAGDICASCGATVGTEEIAQGLAVKSTGKLMCPLCVDHLPGDAKIHINQMRALRGMAVTTYRVFSPRHPGLPLFSFTTTSILVGHRRQIALGNTFHAPPLPPAGSRPRLPTAEEASKGSRVGWLAVALVTVLIVGGLVWLMVPGAKSGPPREDIAPRQPIPNQTPALTPATRDDVQRAARVLAQRLLELEARLRDHPELATEVVHAAELLADEIPARDKILTNRVAEIRLAAIARAAALAKTDPPTPADPPPVTPIQLEPPIQDPGVQPIAPIVPPALQPAPLQDPPAQAPTTTPTIEKPTIEPIKPPVVSTPPAPVVRKPLVDRGPERWDVRVTWPLNHRPVIAANRPLSSISERLPWPWPSGVNIWAGAPDDKAKGKGVAIELDGCTVTAQGGVTVVMHPFRPLRKLAAIWSDGSTATVRNQFVLSEQRWQTVCIPATGTEALDAQRLRLRLEDVGDLPPERPFLIAGATIRAVHLPEESDCQLQLPLIDPLTCTTPDGKAFRDVDFSHRVQRYLMTGFTLAETKVLIHGVDDDPDAVRYFTRELATVFSELRGKPTTPRLGNPDNLPFKATEFTDSDGIWPVKPMGDLNTYRAVVLGWRDQGWGEDSLFAGKIDAVLNKMLTAQPKIKRPVLLPIIAIGEINRASAAEQASINRRWSVIAHTLPLKGIPVIDLRSAQCEPSPDLIRAASARLTGDALRQLDWLLRTYRK
ncbi:MAG: hypothetical protein AAB263_12625 [Planctomycetota bacterium]